MLLGLVIPFLIVSGFFYTMFNDLVYSYLKTNLAVPFLRQFLVLAIIVFLCYLFFVGLFAYQFVHQFFGALPRIFRELDEKIHGKSKTPILLRKNDYGQELIKKINALIEKLP